MALKSEQLQIRVTAGEKAALKRLAKRAGLGVSAYVLSRALPSAKIRFGELVQALAHEKERRFALAALDDLVSSLGSGEFSQAVDEVSLAGLSPFLQNYLAAMVEQGARQKKVAPPGWVQDIEPLQRPYFATPFSKLRVHLLRTSPVAFRRRNIFVDSALGDRV